MPSCEGAAAFERLTMRSWTTQRGCRSLAWLPLVATISRGSVRRGLVELHGGAVLSRRKTGSAEDEQRGSSDELLETSHRVLLLRGW
uniref:Uncharacterized protein n=1 Tax=Arundo donax TaxID=35708 RepID=A0A0A9C466_ARUDO